VGSCVVAGGETKGKAIANLNFRLLENSRKIFLSEKFSFKNAKFGPKTPILGKLKQN